MRLHPVEASPSTSNDSCRPRRAILILLLALEFRQIPGAPGRALRTTNSNPCRLPPRLYQRPPTA